MSVDTITLVMSAVFMLPGAPRSHHMAFVIARLRSSEGIWRGWMMTDLSLVFLLGLALDQKQPQTGFCRVACPTEYWFCWILVEMFCGIALPEKPMEKLRNSK